MAKNGTEFQLNLDLLNFDMDSFNRFIEGNGVPLKHYSSTKCPIGMVDALSIRAPNHDHSECQNGYIYKYEGTVLGSFTNNSALAQLTDVGILDGSSVSVTFPQFYSDLPEKQVYVQTYDRFYIKDLAVVVPNTQLVESHITGIDKLTYYAEIVQHLIDASGREYRCGNDFSLQNGKINWNPNSKPLFDANTGKGMIYAVRYLYTPFFYVQRLVHEVRIAHKTDFRTNQRTIIRAPYAALLAREFFLYKQEADNKQPERNNERTMFTPAMGLLAPK
jgi:hypothetical protein